MLDLRILATTNAAKLDLDKAMMRPGRLCRHIHVDKLSAEKANTVYKRLAGGDPGDRFEASKTLAEIYAIARGDGITVVEPKSNHIGFVSDDPDEDVRV
jgi:hypothetical protein